MEEMSTMMVRSTLPSSNNLGRSEGSMQQDVLLVQASTEDSIAPTGDALTKTVSILAIAPTKTNVAPEASGATVFVGAGGTSSTSTCTNGPGKIPANSRQASIPETVNGYGIRHKDPQQLQTGSLLGHQRSNQQSSTVQHQGQHVSKIRINPELETSRVVSTVHLCPEDLEGKSVKSNGTIVLETKDSWESDDVARLTGQRILESQSDSCVRISVVTGNDPGENHRDANRKGSCDRDESRQREEMIQQRAASNETVNSSNRGCFYYGSFPNSITTMMTMTSSGQCSPSDNLDSGTCSDLDGTPPPLPKKKNSSTVLLGVGPKGHSTAAKSTSGSQQRHHNRAGSVTSSGPELDSDDNESNISCDSLNGGELSSRILDHTSVRVNGVVVATEDKALKIEGEKSCDAILDDTTVVNGVKAELDIQDVKPDDTNDMNMNNNNDNLINNNNKDHSEKENEVSANGTKVDEEMNEINNGTSSVAALPAEGKSNSSSSTGEASPVSLSPAPSGTSSLSKASSTPRVRSPVSNNGNTSNPSSPSSSSPMIKECTYEERKLERDRINEENAAADYYANYNRKKNGTNYLYDDDRFYKFHINENSQCESNDNGQDAKIEDFDNDEYFAGYKILDREAIRSAKGTVRGVKNRVRAGIATFLQNPAAKNYKVKDAGKIVIYVTTMGIVRETYYACLKMLQMLKTHMVVHEIRDLFMSRDLQTELRDRIGCESVEVPQLFVDGQYIGNADAVERLNESGELRRIFKPYKCSEACSTCIRCGGCRLLPCRICNGSKKSPVRNEFTKDFYWLRCMNCDEVGLMRCTSC